METMIFVIAGAGVFYLAACAHYLRQLVALQTSRVELEAKRQRDFPVMASAMMDGFARAFEGSK